MRTAFTPEQLADPHLKDAEHALRTCVHCGFCTATCPTYLLLGDERDFPRGRIGLMQHMLESAEPPSKEAVTHIDRCLSCLGCETACPSGVDYSALIDAARAHIEKTYKRPIADRALRSLIAQVLMRPRIFAVSLWLARAFAPVARLLPGRLGVMAGTIPPRPRPVEKKTMPAFEAKSRVALMPGCVQSVLAPSIDDAAASVLARRNIAAMPLKDAGCCGALAFHLGKTGMAKAYAKRAIEAFEEAPADAVTIAATGCSAFLKEYGRVFAGDPAWQARAENFSAHTKDFVELALRPHEKLAPTGADGIVIAYHPPCSLQHAQRIQGAGEKLLTEAGFVLAPIPDAHLCCGSAGSYSLLQPQIAESLRSRKLASIASTGASVIVSGNIGCLMQLGGGGLPTLHIAELLDWAEGGSIGDKAALGRFR